MQKAYRVGAIGTSWAARSPLPTFQSYDGVELTAICSGQIERAREAADRFGATAAFDDYRTMVQRPDLDIIYVGSPVYLHYPMAMAALEAGKHLLCEKPLALNAVEAQRLLEAAERGGLKHVVAFTMRHFPSIWHTKQLIDDGFLGEVRHVNIVQWGMATLVPPAQTPSSVAAVPAAASVDGPPTWRWQHDAALGGGIIGAVGTHLIDLTRWLCGEYESVSGLARTWNTASRSVDGETREITAPDSFAYVASLKNGALVTTHLGAAVGTGTGTRIELYGSNGTIVIEGQDALRVAGSGERTLRSIEAPPIPWPDDVAGTPVPRFGLMIHKLVRAIDDPSYTPAPNLEDGLQCQKVMDAILISQREGRAVRMDEVSAGAP